MQTDLWDVRILRPHPRGPESETLGGEWRAAVYILRSLQVIWMHTQVWEPLPYINFTVPGLKPLWGNRRNRFCSVPDSLSSGIYWLYLYISSVLGHLLRWEWQKEFANGDHPSELLQQSAFCFCFFGAGDRIDSLMMGLHEHGTSRRNCQGQSQISTVLVLLECADTEQSEIKHSGKCCAPTYKLCRKMLKFIRYSEGIWACWQVLKRLWKYFET